MRTQVRVRALGRALEHGPVYTPMTQVLQELHGYRLAPVS
jgi:hypothetical protein